MIVGKGRHRRGLSGLLRSTGVANRQLSLRDALGVRVELAFPHIPNLDQSAHNGDYFLPEPESVYPHQRSVRTDCSGADCCSYCLVPNGGA